MQTFVLPFDGANYTFDTDGLVFDSSNDVFGKWTTTSDNKIKVAKVAGGNVEVGVVWAFNALNQLTISSGNNLLVALRNSPGNSPRFSLDKNVLVVDPDGDMDFKFPLQCKFGITPAGNLLIAFTGATTTSELDGFLSDSQSRFRFEFKDKGSPGVANALVLSGEWVQEKSANEIRMQFKLTDATQSLDGKPLSLPAALTVDPDRNSLQLVYEKNGKERRIQFLGSLQIREGWKLEFTVNHVTGSGTKTLLVTVETTWEWDAVQGGAKLYVGKKTTANKQEITVGGSFRHTMLKTGTTIGLDFEYTKSTAAGGNAVMTVAASVEFEYKNAQLIVKFKKDTASKTQTLEITGKLQKDDFVMNGGILIANEPSGKRVGVFLGIKF